MNGDQFVWIIVCIGAAWIVFQWAIEESARRRRNADHNAIAARLDARRPRLRPCPEEARRATIAQASYWP